GPGDRVRGAAGHLHAAGAEGVGSFLSPPLSQVERDGLDLADEGVWVTHKGGPEGKDRRVEVVQNDRRHLAGDEQCEAGARPARVRLDIGAAGEVVVSNRFPKSLVERALAPWVSKGGRHDPAPSRGGRGCHGFITARIRGSGAFQAAITSAAEALKFSLWCKELRASWEIMYCWPCPLCTRLMG